MESEIELEQMKLACLELHTTQINPDVLLYVRLIKIFHSALKKIVIPHWSFKCVFLRKTITVYQCYNRNPSFYMDFSFQTDLYWSVV